MPTTTFPVYETTHLRKTAKDLRTLAADLARQAKCLTEDPWSDDCEIALHQHLGAAFDRLERLLVSVGVEL